MYRIILLILTLIFVNPAVSDDLDSLLSGWTAFNSENHSDDLSRGWVALKKGDTETAIKLWTPLAEEGNKISQYNLGKLYSNGKLVTQDHKAAAKWYRLAAEQGHTDAQGYLAIMYIEGSGVPQDDVKACVLLNIAASNGSKKASDVHDLIMQSMSDAEKEEAKKLIVKWVAKHGK